MEFQFNFNAIKGKGQFVSEWGGEGTNNQYLLAS